MVYKIEEITNKILNGDALEELKKIPDESIEQHFGNQSPHHWFNGESFPSKEDYIKLKELLDFNSEYDEQLTEEFVKSSEKENHPFGSNPGDFWDITTKPHKFAHFACYPETLCEIPIKSGCPEFVCNKCGKPKEKIFERPPRPFIHRNKKDGDGDLAIGGKYQEWLDENPPVLKEVISCSCNEGFSGGIVLDPFFGSGTTGLVALKQNKNFIGIELNKEYIKIAEERIKPYISQQKL
jgi:DNA modification methylase